MSSLAKKIRFSPPSYLLYDLFLRMVGDRTKAFIFVATTGRSGSSSLSTAFSGLPNCASFHEPYPLVANTCPPGVERERYFRREFYKRKLPIIRLASYNHDYYVETNHQFIKHFARHAIDVFGSRIRIVHLVREPLKVASSFYALNSIPGRTSRGRKYLLDPAAADNLLQINDLLEAPDFAHDFYKCLWYWYEIEARVRQLKRDCPQVRWFQINTSQLNDESVLRDMFATFDLPVAPALEASSHQPENLKTAGKKLAVPAEAREMHEKLVTRMEERFGPTFWK